MDVENDGSARFVGDEGEGGVDDEKKENVEQSLALSM
jgi:hypothetical protein